MSNEQTTAMAEAYIKQGRDLLDKTRIDIENNAGQCDVSPAMPKLVHWLADVEHAKLKANKLNGQAPSTKRIFKIGPKGIQAEGFDAMDIIRILGFMALIYIILERHGWIPWG